MLLGALACFVSTLAALGQFSRGRASTGAAGAIWNAGGAIAVACGLLAITLVLMRLSAQNHGVLWGALAALAGVGCAAAMRRAAVVADGTLQEDLSLHNQVLNSALNSLSQGVCMFDVEGKLLFWNRRYGDLYGVQEGLRIGMTVRDMLQRRIEAGTFSGDADKYVTDVNAAVHGGKALQAYFRAAGWPQNCRCQSAAPGWRLGLDA